MILFKSYFKILLHNKISIILSFVVFLFMSFAFSLSSSNTEFELKSPTIAITNEGADSIIYDGLIDHLKPMVKFSDIKMDEISIKDALFFHQIDYAALVQPDLTINSYRKPQSSQSFLLDNYINDYLNEVHTYLKTGLSKEEAVTYALNDLSHHTNIEFLNNSGTSSNEVKINRFFNFYVYGFVSVILTGISSTILAFNNPNVLNRSNISSMPLNKRNLFLYLGHATFAIITWAIFAILSCIYFNNQMLTAQFMLYLINTFIFIFPTVTLSFLVAAFIKSRNGISAANNILSLGLSFISGAFVEQELLSPFIINISKFMPAYWFIRNNTLIRINGSNVFHLILPNIAIMLLFSITFMILTLILSRQKSKTILEFDKIK